MIKQNRTKLQFILGGILMLTFAVAGCNNGEKKEAKKDKGTIDTMESKKGSVAPGSDVKPQ